MTPQEIRTLRDNVALSTEGLPALQDWLDNVKTIHPIIADATAGIYCGQTGHIQQPVILTTEAGTQLERYLVMGWYNNHVEFAYLS